MTDLDIVQKAKDQLGLGFPDNYGDEQCIPVSKDDPCLPTGFVQAVERGEPYVTLWKAELLVEQGKALGADKLLLEIDKKHPNTPKTFGSSPRMLTSKPRRCQRMQQRKRKSF